MVPLRQSQAEIYYVTHRSILCSGFLIAGGVNKEGTLRSTEVFNPFTRKACPVNDLPKATFEAKFCHQMLCGGNGATRSCLMFDGSSFSSLPVSLLERRQYHLCWALNNGDVLLLGGVYSPTTTERVSAEGSSSSLDFNLPYQTR